MRLFSGVYFIVKLQKVQLLKQSFLLKSFKPGENSKFTREFLHPMHLLVYSFHKSEHMKLTGITNKNFLFSAVIIFASSFLLFANTLKHQYCLDDAIVITKNQFTQQGFAGLKDIFTTESFTGFFGKQKELVSGSRYRPLSIATFAIENEFFGENPGISHFINILLYAFTGLLIFLLTGKIAPGAKWKYFPLVIALLFVFHPIHTEVVANIKGRDEIMALLFSLAACYAMIKYEKLKKSWLLFVGAFLWLLGILSKENAIVFWVLMPIVLILAGVKKRETFVKTIAAFSVSAIVFLAVRYAVIGDTTATSNELMNNSFINATQSQTWATIFYTLWKYIVLLLFPVQLTYDYYPYHIPLVEWKNAGAIAGLIVYIALGIWLLRNIRKNLLITFAVLLYLLPLLMVANIFFPIGTFMSERFLFIPSAGFCILAALGLNWMIARNNLWKTSAYSLLAVILLLFGIRTISRNPVWQNDYTLFTHDVKISENSAKSNCSAGGILLEITDTIQNNAKKAEVLQQSIAYLKRSVSIHPNYFDALLLLGNAYFKKYSSPDSSAYYYFSLLQKDPNYSLAFNNLQALVNREKNVDIKIRLLKNMLLYQPNDFYTNYQLGKLFGKEKNDLTLAIQYLLKAKDINPNSKDTYVDLGVAYGLKGNYPESATMLQKAVEIDASDTNILINLGITWQNLGQMQKAKECFDKANKLKAQAGN